MKRLLIFLILISTVKVFAQNNHDSIIIKTLHMGKIIPVAGETTLPIEIWGDLILIKAKINDIEGYFLWDNGFSSSAIDKKIAPTVKLKTTTENIISMGIDGNNNEVGLEFKMADHVYIGSFDIQNTAFATIDFEKMIGHNTKPIGIIGGSIICKFNWKFDFDKNTVTVSQKPFESPGIRLPFKIDPYNNSTVPFGINGHMDYAKIDFGSNDNDVNITTKALPFFDNTPKAITIGSLTSSVSGLSRIDTAYIIKDFEYRIGDTATYLSHQFKLNLSNSEAGIRFGNRFFRHYNCIINNTTKLIILSKRTTPINTFPEKNFGAALILQNRKIIVVSLSSNPNMKRYPELKLMDEIVSVNNKKTSDFKNYLDLRNYQIDLLKREKQMILTRSDGKVFTLKPELNTYE